LDVERDLMKEISLTRGLVALVDDEDFEALSKYKWFCVNGYAARKVKTVNGRRNFLMHRAILGLEYKGGEEVDHRNGNKADNRKENLRVCTRSQNMKNYSRPCNNSSGCKGVSLHKLTGKWQAYITCDTKRKHLGLHETIEEARAAYANASLLFHGEFGKVD
jgi:hypothetical protein